ncbi:uncharacterized protein M421DRAFT_326036 [Didymella exigua CBS 183.55]|uniref:Rhodopsin domain-containing protein n=1 Tax=Didymella exigua CBS 183.55 TaxID=1150837 RepID=A0A6A5RCI5_9PLEO|nr:uncharacterized protein M421DRAFT_326036 [Didymella exigua CBS 183.55]KAF1923477.1 hypothetical protein M421DRAFT_326036 [Didymella exigua CBS 183.55]
MAQNTAVNDFLPIIIEMMRNPPDPNEPLPLANHLEVAVGVSVPFLLLSLVALCTRLYTRVKVIRQPGWDDAFVTLAAVFNVVAQSTFLGSKVSDWLQQLQDLQYVLGLKNGIGQHLIWILDTLPTTMKWFYVANAAYTTTTVCIKLSLLAQYLRLWSHGYRRHVTIILTVVVAFWGSAFQFLAWFPCFPVRGFWDKQMDPPAKCYAFGYRTNTEARSTMLAFAGSNMSLDFIIFLVPLTEYFRPNLMRKQFLALTGLFAVGFLVVLMAILRLWSGLKYNNRDVLMYDYTYWLPGVLIFSCLEVDFAIMCASIPIFWPAVKAAWSQITVTKEVIVISESRYEDAHSDVLELGMERTVSLKSNKSTEGLVAIGNMDRKSSYIDTQPAESKMLQIPPLAQTTRMSWGGTPLNG